MTKLQEVPLKGFPITNSTINPSNTLVAYSSNRDITLYNLSTQTSSYGECDTDIVALHFITEDELFSISSSGEICRWSTSSSLALEVKLSRRVTAFTVKNAVFDELGAESIWHVSEGDNDFIYKLNANFEFVKLTSVPTTLTKRQLAFGDGYVVYCSGKSIFYYPIDTELGEHSYKYEGLIKNFSDKENEENVFVEIKAVRDTVAASVAIGRVFIWHDVSTNGIQLTNSHSVHWHKIAASMALTPFGGLISAGAEAVLCKWTVKGATAPTMLPRLAGPVEQVILSPDSSLAALLLEDNSLILVMLASMSLLTQVPTTTWCKRSPNNIFKVDPNSPTIIMNGKPGIIQWLDPLDGKTKNTARVTVRNAADGDMTLVGIQNVYDEVEDVFLSSRTVASITYTRNYTDKNKMLRLWRRCPTNPSMFTLQFTVPISDSIKFLSGCLNSVSVDQDVYILSTENGQIYTYARREDEDGWFLDAPRCTNWKNLKVQCVSNIQEDLHWASAHTDGTSDHVVVWNVRDVSVKETIKTDSTIKCLQWANSTYLIISTYKSIYSWNVSTGTLAWKVNQPLSVHVGPVGCYAWEDKQVIRFDPATGALLESVNCSAKVQEVIALKNEQGDRPILGVKTTRGIVILREPSNKLEVADPSKPTPFASLPAANQQPSATSTSSTYQFSKVPNALSLLNGPCYALPPISLLAPQFISSCLAPATNA